MARLTTIDPAGASIGGPTATLIYDDWYPALRSHLLRGNKLRTAMLLDPAAGPGSAIRWSHFRHA